MTSSMSSHTHTTAHKGDQQGTRQHASNGPALHRKTCRQPMPCLAPYSPWCARNHMHMHAMVTKHTSSACLQSVSVMTQTGPANKFNTLRACVRCHKTQTDGKLRCSQMERGQSRQNSMTPPQLLPKKVLPAAYNKTRRQDPAQHTVMHAAGVHDRATTV